MKLLFQLFFQFFHIGIFSFGGGYATIPFLYDIAQRYHWYTVSQLTDMIAISSITPGPVGINMATFSGYCTMGIAGSVIATFAIILPSYIIVNIIYNVLNKFKTSLIVSGIVKALKPAGCGLLSAIGIKLLFTSNLHLIGLIVLGIFIGSSFVKKFDPLVYLSVSAIIGVVLGYFNLIGI